MTSPEPARTARSEYREAFWTLAVGAPAALSVLRLWVESGGELQTTLLLVANVGPLNLSAALFATLTQLATIILVALFTTGAVLRAAVEGAPEGSRLRAHPPRVARVVAAAPPWFVVTTFILAVLTWKIYYLPLLVPAAVAVSQRQPWRLHDRWQIGVGVCLLALAGYYYLVGPAAWAAWTGGERLIALLFALSPLVACGIAGPAPDWFARVFSVVAQLAITGLATWAVLAAVQTPILPLVVTEVKTNAAPGTGNEVEFLRGHIVSVDDVHLVLLRERGGIRYVPTDDVRSTVLCGTPEELPRFTTLVRGYHVEDSLLRAIGRRVRPQVQIDPLCRITGTVR
ncbi:MAG TPA: hypothetical protein VFM55_04690 [Micromonosporaceae bacterium]|nr:hypothetical protein [Micromonosporaceae bacterium]